MVRWRMDQWLVENHTVSSRSEAHALIQAGRVWRNGIPITRPSTLVSESDRVEVRTTDEPSYVGRGAQKLKAGLEAFGEKVYPLWYVDIGASTGGFTDYLLRHGALGVIAIDVGHHQLHARLRGDKRVVVMEDTHILHVQVLPRPISHAVMDVSFISLRRVFHHVWALLTSPRWCMMLLKPQFEVGRARVQKGGVVRDMSVIQETVTSFIHGLKEKYPAVCCHHGLCSVKGKKKGNQEVWILAKEAYRCK